MSPSTKSLVDCDEQTIFICILVTFLECVKSSCLLIKFTTEVNINYIKGHKWRNALMGHWENLYDSLSLNQTVPHYIFDIRLWALYCFHRIQCVGIVAAVWIPEGFSLASGQTLVVFWMDEVVRKVTFQERKQYYTYHPVVIQSKMFGIITKFQLIGILRKLYLSQLEVE